METDNRRIDYGTIEAKVQYGRKLRSQYTVETIIRVYKKLQGLFNGWRLGIQLRRKR
ncbi:MAG: hypothetical protein MI862_15985 [Desulfobacterales bacterium]|nr:hypothetical protein [Desulfobacterales bacterium]